MATPQSTKAIPIKAYIYAQILIFFFSFSIHNALAIHRSPVQNIQKYKSGILYNNSQDIYFNSEELKLPLELRGEFGNLKTNHINAIGNDFYISNQLGLFKNFRRIFSYEEVFHSLIGKEKIFLCSQSGIYYTDKNSMNYKWNLMPTSPQGSLYASLNKSKTNIEYLASRNGFYYYNSRKKQWIARNIGLKRNPDGEYGFGRFIRTQGSEVVLPSSTGLYRSLDGGISWKAENKGLQVDENGLYELRETISDGKNFYLIGKTGLYISVLEDIHWSQVHLEESLNDQNFNKNISSIYRNKKILILGNSAGQILELKTQDISQPPHNSSSKTKQPKNQPSKLQANDQEKFKLKISLGNTNPTLKGLAKIKEVLGKEPSIRELHKAALKFAGIPTGKRFNSYKLQARLRNLLPNFEAFMDAEDTNINSIESTGSEDFSTTTSNFASSFDEENFFRDDLSSNSGIKFSWNLSNLIYDPEINDLNTNARITANIRENILTEITQIYFRRKGLLLDILKSKQEEPEIILEKAFLEKELELEELTAQLDARTGGWFTKRLKEDGYEITI